MKRNYLKNISVVFFIFFTFIFNAQIVVDNSYETNTTYSNLQEAINTAPNNSTIYVQPSIINYGNISINKPLTIIGRSHSEPNFITKILDITIYEGGSGSKFESLFINDINFKGSDSDGSTAPKLVENVNIINCAIENLNFNRVRNLNNVLIPGSNNILINGNIVRGKIEAYNPSSGSTGVVTNLIISNNIFPSFNNYDGIEIGNPESTTIKNNIFYETILRNKRGSSGKLLIEDCIFISKTNISRTISIPDSKINNCLTYNYGSGNYNIISNSSNINMEVNNMQLNTNPLFKVFDLDELFKITNDYSFQTESPAIGTGVQGKNLGVTGNNYSFSPIGNPSNLPTVKINASTSIVPQNGKLTINITAKTN